MGTYLEYIDLPGQLGFSCGRWVLSPEANVPPAITDPTYPRGSLERTSENSTVNGCIYCNHDLKKNTFSTLSPRILRFKQRNMVKRVGHTFYRDFAANHVRIAINFSRGCKPRIAELPGVAVGIFMDVSYLLQQNGQLCGNTCHPINIGI